MTAMERRILAAASTARNGMSAPNLFLKIAVDDPDRFWSWNAFNEALLSLEKQGYIFLGKNQRYYDGAERSW